LLNLLITGGIPLEKIKTENSDNEYETTLWLNLTNLETEAGPTQRIFVRYQLANTISDDLKELRPFPKSEINQNMLSLWTLNMARLMMLNTVEKI